MSKRKTENTEIYIRTPFKRYLSFLFVVGFVFLFTVSLGNGTVVNDVSESGDKVSDISTDGDTIHINGRESDNTTGTSEAFYLMNVTSVLPANISVYNATDNRRMAYYEDVSGFETVLVSYNYTMVAYHGEYIRTYSVDLVSNTTVFINWTNARIFNAVLNGTADIRISTLNGTSVFGDIRDVTEANFTLPSNPSDFRIEIMDDGNVLNTTDWRSTSDGLIRMSIDSPLDIYENVTVARWAFDNNISDVVGDHDLIKSSGQEVYDPVSKEGTHAFDFGDTGGRNSLYDNYDIDYAISNVSGVTFGGWVFYNESNPFSINGAVMGQWQSADQGIVLFHYSGTGGFRVTARNGSGTNNIYADSPNVLSLNRWTWVVARFNGTHISIFEDGVEVVSVLDTDGIRNSTDRMEIGRYNKGLTTSSYWFGRMDDLFWMNVSLSDEQIYVLAESYGLRSDNYTVEYDVTSVTPFPTSYAVDYPSELNTREDGSVTVNINTIYSITSVEIREVDGNWIDMSTVTENEVYNYGVSWFVIGTKSMEVKVANSEGQTSSVTFDINVIERTRTFAVKVKDVYDREVEGALVTLETSGSEAIIHVASVSASNRTDERGIATFEVTADLHDIYVSSNGLVDYFKEGVDTSAEGTVFTVEMLTYSVTVTVLGDGSTPVENIRVNVREVGKRSGQEKNTNSDGNTTFYLESTKYYVITIENTSYIVDSIIIEGASRPIVVSKGMTDSDPYLHGYENVDVVVRIFMSDSALFDRWFTEVAPWFVFVNTLFLLGYLIFRVHEMKSRDGLISSKKESGKRTVSILLFNGIVLSLSFAIVLTLIVYLSPTIFGTATSMYIIPITGAVVMASGVVPLLVRKHENGKMYRDIGMAISFSVVVIGATVIVMWILTTQFVSTMTWLEINIGTRGASLFVALVSGIVNAIALSAIVMNYMRYTRGGKGGNMG